MLVKFYDDVYIDPLDIVAIVPSDDKHKFMDENNKEVELPGCVIILRHSAESIELPITVKHALNVFKKLKEKYNE